MERRIPLGIRGPPPEVIRIFRSEATETDLSISIPTEISGIFGIMKAPITITTVTAKFGRVFAFLTQERLGTKEKPKMAPEAITVVKVLFLRQTIDEETAFGVLSLSKRIFRCEFVCQCKKYAWSRLKNT